MNPKALATFYGLSIFVLLTAFFVLRPSDQPAVKNFQTDIMSRFNIAWQQTWGDQAVLSGVAAVYQGVTAFYEQSADSLTAMLSYPSADADIASIFSKIYQNFAMSTARIAAKTLPPPVLADNKGDVAGTQILAPVSKLDNSPWFTATDGLTGQKYCLAIYNGEINKYLGECANEYH